MISADPGRRQGGARQGREVVDNKKYNNGSWEDSNSRKEQQQQVSADPGCARGSAKGKRIF